MENQFGTYPIIIENSNIEFALMGPVGRHRGVIVKSADASPDLIGYDNPYVDMFSGKEDLNRIQKRSGIKLLWTLLNRPRTNVVRSFGAVVPRSENRKSHYTFVWKGMYELKDFEKFQFQFEGAAADLNEALKGGEGSEIEWLMAGIIASCSMMQDRAKINRETYRAAMIIYSLIVALGVTVLFSSYFVRVTLP